MNFSLFLYAENSKQSDISKTQLINYLTELNFISSQTSSLTLSAGSKLMDYITFLGCSPSLQLGDIESPISIHQFNEVVGLGGESIETIRYPGCKHPVTNPVKLLKSYPDNDSWQCPNCDLEGKTNEIQWRKTAGFSNIFIEINHIFPKEAVPSDKLLSCLNDFTKCQWQWFYSATTSV